MGRFQAFLILNLLFLSTFAIVLSPLNPVFASHTKASFRNQSGTSLVGIANGTNLPVNIYASDVDDPDGLAAYEFTINFDNRYLQVADSDLDGILDAGVVTSGPFLTSSGKQALCPTSTVTVSQTNPNISELNISCGTLATTPAGPQGSGNLATVNFTTKNLIGTTTLTMLESYLLDNTADVNEVPHLKINVNIPIAKCAFLDSFSPVTIGDLSRMISHFGTYPQSPNWNPAADLNADNIVSVLDLSLAVAEFGRQCPT